MSSEHWEYATAYADDAEALVDDRTVVPPGRKPFLCALLAIYHQLA